MAGRISFGTSILIGTVSPPTTVIADVLTVEPPAMAREAVDITSHGSSGGIMERIPDGVVDPGNLTFTLNHIANSATDIALISAMASGVLQFIRWTVNAATGVRTYTASGVMTSYGVDTLDTKGKQTASVSFALTGAVTAS